MLDYLPMAMPTREELLQRFPPVEDPEIKRRRKHMIKVLLEQHPEVRQELIDAGRREGPDEGLEKRLEERREKELKEELEWGLKEGRLTGTRTSLRRVLALRNLTPNKDDDAYIDACTDLAALERWLDRAITAASISDVLA